MLNAEEVAFILDHSGATGVIAEDALERGDHAGDRRAADDACAAGSRSAGVAAPGRAGTTSASGSPTPTPTAPDVVVGDDDPIQLMYTSGTESRPKGAIMTSRTLIQQYVGCIVDGGMTSDDVEVHALPFYHCAQLHCFLTVDVYLGATSIVLPGPDPALILATIERYGVTKLFCPPTVWIALLRHPAFDTTDLSSLRKGYYGASPMPAEVLRELAERLPDVALWNFYGQTEMAPLATILQPARAARRASARPVGPASTSRPASSTTTARRSRPAPSARSSIAARRRRPATGTTRPRRPRRSRAAGSTPATSG